MNTHSTSKRPFGVRGLIVLAVVAAVAMMALPVAAQPAKGGPWEKLDLTRAQRNEVREIVKNHRESSRAELMELLSSVMTPEQQAEMEKMDGQRRGPFQNRKGVKGKRGMRGQRGMKKNCVGNNPCCDHGQRGRAGMREGRGGHGPGPHMGEFREEHGQRMVEMMIVALDLNDDQAAKVRDVVKEHQGQFKDFDRSKLSFEERQKTRDAHRMLLRNRLKEFLTEDQIAKLEELHETMGGPQGKGCGKARGMRN